MVHRRLLMILLLVTALVGCTPAPAQTPMPPVATETHVAVGLRSNGYTVVASGEIVPARKAQLSFMVAGRVQTVTVAEGDEVQTGEVLVTLETAPLEAGVAQAEATLMAAQAQLMLLEAGPRPGEVAVVEAQLEAARAALAQAAAQQDQFTSEVTEAELAAIQAQLITAQAEEMTARDAYDQLQDQKVDEWVEEVASLRLRAAEQARAAAEAQLAQAEEGAEVQIRAAQAAVWTAAAQRDAAQAQLDMLQAGATVEEIAAAEATVAQAEAALQAARAMLDQATLRAPFAGAVIVLEVSPGETVMPGQAVLTLADLSHLQVQTTDLSERDVVQVAVGRQATVYVEAFGIEIGGQVVDIAPQANTAGGDVVYAVTIELDEQPPGLRWGMSVEVEIGVH
jgi:multidrug efflux pump subunit AcrA (membrane-fusion protein)